MFSRTRACPRGSTPRAAVARPWFLAPLLLLPVSVAGAAGWAPPPMRLEVDAREVMAGVQHAQLVVPVRPGPLALAYPRWLPGEHRASGPITQLVNLRMEAGGRPLAWQRDPLDPFVFRVEVPAGSDSLDVRFDYLSPSAPFGNGFGKAPNMTPHLQWVLFNHLLLYPADAGAQDLQVLASVRLPPGWTADGALPARMQRDGALSLPAVSLARLVDSPMLAGQFLHSLPLPAGRRANVRISVAADNPADARIGLPVQEALRRLVGETFHLFGEDALPGDGYAWLVALSDLLTHDGLEHLESADVRAASGFFRDARQRVQWSVLSHEFFHAWNGKAVRPAEQAGRNFQQPMRDGLLWFYEGLTRYYGDVVLPARSGLATPQQVGNYLAYVAAQIGQERPGRAWRSLADTAVATPAYGEAPLEGTAVRRGSDYYNEMLLVWLEADVLIRQRSHGQRSLDDFCRRFFARAPGADGTRTYAREDIVRSLRAVEDLDWEQFLHARIEEIRPEPPLGGLLASGWSVAYDDRPNPFIDDVEAANASYDFMTSLGLRVDGAGRVQDVLPGSPAAALRIGPGMRITRIGPAPWSLAALRDGLRLSPVAPVELQVAYGDVVRTLPVPWREGLRVPHLRRDPSRPDLLSGVLAPQVPPSVPRSGPNKERSFP